MSTLVYIAILNIYCILVASFSFHIQVQFLDAVYPPPKDFCGSQLHLNKWLSLSTAPPTSAPYSNTESTKASNNIIYIIIEDFPFTSSMAILHFLSHAQRVVAAYTSELSTCHHLISPCAISHHHGYHISIIYIQYVIVQHMVHEAQIYNHGSHSYARIKLYTVPTEI